MAANRRGGVLDLTHPLSPELPMYPGYDPAEVYQRFALPEDGCFAQRWTLEEHCGTHVDAPAHFAADGCTVEEIPAERLVLRAAVIDVRERVERDHDAMVGVDDILAWEARHGRLGAGFAVLALTGWDLRAASAAAYLNADRGGVMHFPGFDPATAAFLRDDRAGVHALGIDAPSLDFGATSDFAAHVAWLPSGRYGIENLTGLERLGPSGGRIFVGAAPLRGGSGAPARVLATVG